MKISKVVISWMNEKQSFLARCFGILTLVFPSLYVNRKLFDVGHRKRMFASKSLAESHREEQYRSEA